MKRLILIRHGETDYSAKKQYCGFQDISLNPKGLKQSNRLKYRLERFKIDKVYSSDLRRCLDTAYVIFNNKTIHKRKCLREINFGVLAGLRYDELKKEYPKIYKFWFKHPEKLKMPKGEYLTDFASRVEHCFDRIVKENPRKIVALVAHGGSIRIILLKLLKKDLDKIWEIEQGPCALTVIDFIKGIPKILRLNDTSHLKGL